MTRTRGLGRGFGGGEEGQVRVGSGALFVVNREAEGTDGFASTAGGICRLISLGFT